MPYAICAAMTCSRVITQPSGPSGCRQRVGRISGTWLLSLGPRLPGAGRPFGGMRTGVRLYGAPSNSDGKVERSS